MKFWVDNRLLSSRKTKTGIGTFGKKQTNKQKQSQTKQKQSQTKQKKQKPYFCKHYTFDCVFDNSNDSDKEGSLLKCYGWCWEGEKRRRKKKLLKKNSTIALVSLPKGKHDIDKVNARET